MDRTFAPNYTVVDGKRVYQDRDKPNGIPGTSLLAEDRTKVEEELIGGLIETAGLTPDRADLRQINQALRIMCAAYERGIAPWQLPVAQRIGGYPLNAIVCDPAAPGVFWVSISDSNVSTPGANGANWQSLFNGYATQTWVNGRFLPSTAPNPAVGDAPITDLYYAGGIGHVWAAISDRIYGSLAWYSDVTTVQTNLTTALAAQSDTNADVQTQIGKSVSGVPQVRTDAQGIKLVQAAGSTSPDGVARPQFYYNGGNVFLATEVDVATLSSRLTSEITTRSDQVSDLNTQVGNRIVGLAGSGFITVQSLVVDQTSQNLTLNLGNGVVAQEYAQVQTGVINDSPAFGWWKKTRLPDGSWLLEQEYVVTGLAGNAAHKFPMEFASSPVLTLTCSNDTGTSNQHKSIFPNYLQGTLTASGVTLDVFYYDNANGSCALSGDFILSVRAVGPVAS